MTDPKSHSENPEARNFRGEGGGPGRVYIVKCEDYDQVEKKLRDLLEMMGGIGRFVKPGQRIILKPNLLLAARPEKAVTTHPAVVAAMGKIAREITPKIGLIDSPGSGYAYNRKALEKTYRTCGMQEAADEAGLELSYDESFETVSFPAGTLVKQFSIITPIRTCDGYINLCKMKTHGLTFMTGATKNIFGLIPGRAKVGYHGTMTTRELFAAMLLDLMALAPPKLTIMDAVIGMEGEGPSGGRPRRIGLLIASDDPLALDIVASEIMGLPQERNPLLTEAKKRNLHPSGLEDVDVIGVPKEQLRIEGFKLPSSFAKERFHLSALFAPVAKSFFTVDPRIIKTKCTACGACRDACPRDAITVDETAEIDKKKCIRCYCCHEMCAYNAVELHRSLFYRIMNKT